MCRMRIGWYQLMNPPDHFVRASSSRHSERACDMTDPPSYTTILKTKNTISHYYILNLKKKHQNTTHFCPGSRVQVPGIVKHSSPPWKKRSTSPPNTNPTYFIREIPVPYGCTDQWVTWKLAFTTDTSFSFVVCYQKTKPNNDYPQHTLKRQLNQFDICIRRREF